MKKSGFMRKFMALILSVVIVITLMPQIGGLSKVSADETANSQPDYLTFTAAEADSSVTLNWVSGTDVKIKMGTDTEWSDYAEGTNIVLSNIGDSVSFKGKNVTTGNDKHFAMEGKIKASGSVTSLTDEMGNDPEVQLERECYFSMFSDCTSLETAPKLPATSLADFCYGCMFYNCTSLKIASELPAKTLAKGCYYSMFNGCTSLETAPELPATSLVESCYNGMFYRCTGLETVPELKTPDSSIRSAYYRMFAYCTNLVISTEIDEEHSLPWTAPQNVTYSETFDETTKVDFGNGSKEPEAGVTYYTKCYHDYNSDNECTICGYTKAEPNYLAFTAAEADSSVTFNWKSADKVQIKRSTDADWSDYTAGTEIILSNIGDSVSFRGKNVTTDYKNHFAMTGKIEASGSVTSLTDENGNDPEVKLSNYCYQYMFYQCTGLKTAPELPAIKLSEACYQYMFYECSNLKVTPKLPATTMAYACYYYMFANCTNLIGASALEATYKYEDHCYAQMFEDCKNLRISTEKDEQHSIEWKIAYADESQSMFKLCPKVSFESGSNQAIAGKIYYTGCDHDYGSDNKCKICGWEKPATEINTVDITISAPTPNDSFSTSATCSTTGVASASAIKWTKADGTAVSENEKAQYGTEYYANITLKAADGYAFTNTTAVKCNSETCDGTAVKLNGNGTLTVKISFTTAKAKLLGITKPQQNINVGFGAAKTTEGLGLPETVAVETELSEVTSADIEWNLDDVNYDKTKYEEQTFDVTGTIVLPETIDSNGIDLSVKLSVTVSAAKKISYTATGYTGRYDGKTHGITVNVTDPADATIMYSLNQVTGAKNEFKDTGTYKVYYYINKEGYEPEQGSCIVKIDRKVVVTSTKVENKTYDGTTDATVSAEINTGIEGERFTISGISGKFEDANAGQNKKVNIDNSKSYIDVDETAPDTKRGNYEIIYLKTATADITSKPVNLQWLDTSLTYNGKDQIPKAEVDKSGIIGDDTVNVTVAGAKKDAGNNYTATASLTNDNYMIGKGSTQSFSIAPKKITVKADDKEKHAGKADPEFTYIVKDNGLVSGDELKDIQFTRNGGENAGNYDICIVVPDGSNPNYDIASESGTLTVNDHTYSAAAYTWSDDNAECTAVKKCTECDEQITETVKAKITEVQKVSCTLPEIKSFEAAFTKAGFTKQVKENVQTAEALGHKWDDGVITKEPTYTADGEKKFTCTNCNETRTEVIKKLFDNEAPKVEISCAANKWNQFLNTITFGHFFKETKEVSITASDDQTKNPEIWYFVSDKVCSEAEIKSDDISWIRYTGKVSLQKNSKNIIYAKAIDDAGNITVVNSDGIVIYTDSVETGSVSFDRLQTEDVKTEVTVNGNTVSKILIGDTEEKAEDISKAVEIKNDTLVFKADYLNTVRPGTYTVTVSYDPMGEKYLGNDKNDAPKDSVITLTVNRIKGELTVDANALNKTYDGTAVAAPVISTKNDTADGKVKYEYKQRYADDSTYTTTAPKDAGEYTVKATVAADYTYTEAVAYADFTISKKTVDIIWSDADFTFNGKEQKPTAAVADKDICKGDTADVAVSVSDGGIAAGEHKAQAHIENSNYVISTADQETFTYTIKPKKITLTANDKVKHVGDKNPVFDYTAEGLVEGYTDLVNIGTRVEKGESVGTYKIFVEEISTGVNPNYDITTVPGTLTIADHTYADTTYTWSADNTECTAARKCTFCDKTDTETAGSKAEVTQEKTCTLPELTKYTVTFKNDNGTDFADQVKENVQTAEATGHKWDSGVQSKAPTYTEEGEMLYTCETCGETKTEVIEKLKLNEYDILEGADGTHVLKEDGSYSVRINCAIEYFVAVQIDGKTVDSADYTVESGSTIVTFTKEFMDSLSVGDHEVKFIFTNGTAKAAIKVVEKTQDTDDKSSSSTDTQNVATTPKATDAKTPATQQKKAAKSGDENPARWVLFLIMLGGAGAATYGCKRKKAR